MAVRASMSRFPVDPDSQESSGLPWGVTVTPFSQVDEIGNPPVCGYDGHHLPRCENCWAYFNTYCDLEQWAWNCSLCGAYNGLTSQDIDRYSDSQRQSPEMRSSFIDLELPLEGSAEERMKAQPVYVAAVDMSSSEEFLELIKSALLAALEALVPGSLFGLITFSHKIGLYDVQGPIPVVKNVFIHPDSDGLKVELEDVMPLFSFLAPVDTYKENIAAALETLKPTTSWERTTVSDQDLDGFVLGGRGFGVTMEALINYLGSEYGKTFALARVFAFLSGPPDYGAGQLDTRRYGEQYASRREDADLALLPEQTPFYKDLAAIAIQAGICVDIFAVTNEYTDLASLKFLSIESGGSLFLYPSTDDSTLPQDMYRMLSRPYVFGCVLRLRTSSEFKPGRSYGHFFPDPQYENVQHIICCDSFATYAYDLEFENTSGFSRCMVLVSWLEIRSCASVKDATYELCYSSSNHFVIDNNSIWDYRTTCEKGEKKKQACTISKVEVISGNILAKLHTKIWRFDLDIEAATSHLFNSLWEHFLHTEPPVIQIAFQYTVIIPNEDTPETRPKHTIQRRLRIRTLQFTTGVNINEIYDSVDPEVVLSILVHKVILASLEQGVREGRTLLHDWLVILTAQYNDAYKLVQYETGSSVSRLDVAFSQCAQLQSLPHLIFALLRNPLLRLHEEGVHPDYRIYLQCLFSALDAASLSQAIYPVLTSYATPDKQAYPRHSLSRAALLTSGSPIFFLDSFTNLIVYYSPTADPSLPFPPPQHCLLRTTINKLKQERSITPKLTLIRGGQDDATTFENYLIEEQDIDGSAFTGNMGFVPFLEDISRNVADYLKQEA